MLAWGKCCLCHFADSKAMIKLPACRSPLRCVPCYSQQSILDIAKPLKVAPRRSGLPVSAFPGRALALCRNKNTFARMSDPLGFVKKEDLLYAVKAVVAAQRDYGRRDDRKQSRLKYLVHEWGIDKFRSVVEQYFGKKMEAFR